jgi:hypothetical protein
MTVFFVALLCIIYGLHFLISYLPSMSRIMIVFFWRPNATVYWEWVPSCKWNRATDHSKLKYLGNTPAKCRVTFGSTNKRELNWQLFLYVACINWKLKQWNNQGWKPFKEIKPIHLNWHLSNTNKIKLKKKQFWQKKEEILELESTKHIKNILVKEA